jgi:DNA-binding ferritin-like protein
MTSSNLEKIFQATTEAPTQEVVTEEVVVVKEATVENLVYKLVRYASFTYHLNTQAHLLHLNLETPFFLSLHKFLRKQYEQHIAEFDTVSELVRSMDFLLPMCQKGLLGMCKEFKHVSSYDATEGLTTYTKNLEAAGFMAKELVDMAREVGAPDVENELATIVGNCFKSAWMLKATLRNGGVG